MATDKRLTFDIDANNAEAIRSLDEIQRKALNVQQTLSKTASKSVANNSTVTSKDTSSVYRGLDDLQSSIQSLTSQMQTLKGARENLLASGGRNSDIAKLNTTLGQLVQGLSNVYRTTGADGNRISNRGGKFSQDLDRVNNSHVRATSAFVNRNDPSYVKRQVKNQGDLSGYRRQYNDARTVAGIDDNIRSAQASGRMSYANYQSTNARIDYRKKLVNEANKNFDASRDSYSAKLQDNNSRIASMQKASENGQGDFSEQIANLQKMNQEYVKLITQLDDFKDGLKKASENLDKQKSDLNNSVSNGSVKVDPRAGSFAAYMKQMTPRATRTAVLAAGASLTQAASQGASVRRNMSTSMNNLMMGSAVQNGKSTAYADHDLNKQIDKVSLTNGANFTNEQLAKITSNYQQATGDMSSNNAIKVADMTSKFSRFNNISEATANDIVTQTGQTGAINNTNDLNQLESSIQNAIDNSNMSAKADTQAQALQSIYSTFQGRQLSTSQASDLAGLQGSMAKYGSSMQGTAGASAYEGITGIFTNGYNNAVARQIFGGNNAKYAGIHGQAQLYDDMQNMDKKPEVLKNAIGNSLKLVGGDTEVAASNLSQMSNGSLSVDQAKKFISMYQNGDLNSKTLKKYTEDTKKSKKAQSNKTSAYTSSGVSSLDKASALASRNVTEFSQSLDKLRQVINSVGSNTSATSNIIAGGIAGGVAGFASNATSGLIMKGGGKLLGKGASALGFSKIAKFFGEGGKAAETAASASTVARTATTANTIGRAGKLGKAGQYLDESGSILSKLPKIGGAAKVISSAGKISKFAAGSAIIAKGASVLGKTTTSVGNFAKGSGLISKGAGILGKSGGFIKAGGKLLGKVAVPLQVASDGIGFATSKKGTKSHNSSIGGMIGTAGGAIVGGAIGAFAGGVGAAPGASVGASAGGLLGNWIGGFFGKSDKDKEKTKTKEKVKATPKRDTKDKVVQTSTKNNASNQQLLSRKSNEGTNKHNNQNIGGSQGSTNKPINMNVTMNVNGIDGAKDGAKTLGRNIVQSLRSGMADQMDYYSKSLSQSSNTSNA